MGEVRENGTAEAGDIPARVPVVRPLLPHVRRQPARFKEADVMRVIKAAQKAKLPIAAVRIEPDGAILVIPGTPEAVPSSDANPWDDAS